MWKNLRFWVGVVLILGTSFNAISQSNACIEAQEFKIVVLGSSTAAGAGTSTSDSAWVNRYRNYLQSINPNNDVVNLAVGGYNTYRIMQTGFTPPSNRPNPDTLRNITTALSHNPDAIIVNMPSNDVASNYTVAEQMQNLNAIQQLSVQAGVPIWICTTQPRNFSVAQAQLQEDIKDSIYADFAPFVIDFWTTIATSANLINPVYNSGDGVHLNDLGHALLFERVLDQNILSHLFQPVSYTDFFARDIIPMVSKCGDSMSVFKFVYANVGMVDSSLTQANFHLENLSSGAVETQTHTITTVLDSCNYDTVSFIGNTYAEGNYRLTALISNLGDTNAINDTLKYDFNTLGHPSTQLVHDTLCSPGQAEVFTFNQANDSTFWYASMTDTLVINHGASYSAIHIDSTTSWYAQTVRGNRFFSNTLAGSSTSSINWNGTMFNLLANTHLIVDSLDLVINTLGVQMVEVYTKSGSYVGFEGAATAWTLVGTFTVDVTNTSEFTSVPVGGFSLPANDTTGVYVQLVNPNVRLAYQYVSSPNTRSNSELTMISGSGISHNFTGTYFPRDWKGNVHYHFGYKPLGDCSTPRLKATAYVSETSFDLGPDSIIGLTDTLNFQGPPGMLSYLWFDGSTADSFSFIATNYAQGIHHVTLLVTDSLLCSVENSTVIGVANLVSTISELENEAFSVYPNPTTGTIYLEIETVQMVELYSLNGELLKRYVGNIKEINVMDVPQGLYLLKVTSNGTSKFTKITKH